MIAQTPMPPPKPSELRSNRTLWLIIAVCVAPVIISYFMYYVVAPGGETNTGAIYSPTPELANTPITTHVRAADESNLVDVLRLLPPDEQAQRSDLDSLADYGGRWLMVVRSPRQCNAECEKLLTDVRQIRLASGRERTRIERLWWLEPGASPIQGPAIDPKFDGELRGTYVVEGPWSAQPQYPTGDAPTVYIIDPLGRLVMQFASGTEPAKIRKDLGRLLKASRIG